jgi:hypothetical protein
VSYRKGELTKSRLNREWPHQVALRADFVAGANLPIIGKFKDELNGCPRGHSVMHKDIDYVVFCFAEKEQADRFSERFGGEPFNPKDRGTGNSWRKWNKPEPGTRTHAKRI